ncbi:MAG: hypothetical protein ACK58L_10515 [Planctomycetota bacterium]
MAVENLKIADELIRLKPKALELIAEQSEEQSQQLIDSIFTEESILEHAQQQHALNPDGPTVGQIIEQINETQLPALQEQLEELFSNTAEKSLDLLLKGDMQIYQFKAASTDKRFPEFVKGMREMRNGIDISSTKFEFGYGVMPDVKSFKNRNQPSDFIHLFDKLQPTASISAPIKYDGLVVGSIGANLSGVSFEDWTTRPLDQIEKLDLSVSSSIGYKRSWDIDQMIFDHRYRADFELKIERGVKMTPIESGEIVPKYWHDTESVLDANVIIGR